jgi:TolB-like protein/class 3 adenylate cyclase
MENYRRKLTAIFSADVAGYSRLMGNNEAATVDTLTSYREVMYSLIKQYRGRVVDSPGDNILAEFASVVDAVQCGVSVQKELQSRNSGLPESRRMQFRIGINLGDVIEEGERIYGDGVNIAARLEALADPGGICVSKTAFDHIESKLPLGYEFIGEQTVKNISKPVFAYKVIMDPRVISSTKIKRAITKSPWIRNSIIAVGIVVLLLVLFSVIIMIPKCSDQQTGRIHDQRPSIVILPFKNMSDDSAQEHFSDGITEELIHSLARIDGLKVISQTTSFYYKGKNVPLSSIGKDLGVDHVLEGSVRKDGNKLRINAQLISVVDDTHLWSETYDREMKEIFNIQDEISKAVVKKLKIELLGDEEERKKEYSIIENERRTGINVIINEDEIITGGLFATGLNIVMEGSVKGGLKAYGGHVVISGNSQDVVDFWGGEVLLSGNFQDKVKGTAGNLIISGTFEKDLEVNAKNKITITPEAVIKGDLIYSEGKLDRKKGSQIAGKITQVDVGDMEIFSIPAVSKEKNVWSTLLGKTYWYLSILVIAFFVKYLMPRQSEKVIDTLVSDPITKNLKRGILFSLVGPLIILLSFMTVIGVPFGLICIPVYSLFFYPMSVLYSGVWIGRKVLRYFKASLSDGFIISLTTGFIVVELISLIPFIEWFLKIFLMLVAVGAIWRATWSAVKTSREEAADATG